jgi:hypothetical protein
MALCIHGQSVFVCPDHTSVNLTGLDLLNTVYLGYDRTKSTIDVQCTVRSKAGSSSTGLWVIDREIKTNSKLGAVLVLVDPC